MKIENDFIRMTTKIVVIDSCKNDEIYYRAILFLQKKTCYNLIMFSYFEWIEFNDFESTKSNAKNSFSMNDNAISEFNFHSITKISRACLIFFEFISRRIRQLFWWNRLLFETSKCKLFFCAIETKHDRQKMLFRWNLKSLFSICCDMFSK